MQRSVEIGILPDTDEPVFLKQDEKGILTCHPWPFAANSFKVSVECFETDELLFESDSELRKFLTSALPDRKTFSFAKE